MVADDNVNVNKPKKKKKIKTDGEKKKGGRKLLRWPGAPATENDAKIAEMPVNFDFARYRLPKPKMFADIQHWFELRARFFEFKAASIRQRAKDRAAGRVTLKERLNAATSELAKLKEALAAEGLDADELLNKE